MANRESHWRVRIRTSEQLGVRMLRGRQISAVVAAIAVVFAVNGSSWARTVRTRVHAGIRSSMRMKSHPVAMRGEEVVPGVMPVEESSSTTTEVMPTETTPVTGKPYRLRMSNLHTGESLDIVYRIGNTYVPDALEKLNYFLRDHNTQDVSNYDPKEFDVLHAMMARLGRMNGLIDVVCGYRTPETNAALRQNSSRTGVAEHSQHMEGHAIDLRVPGASTAQIRNAALSLRAGGVGYYPVSQFVHVDVGPVREWEFGISPRRVGRRARRVRAAM
jgi:uncharacterized protein YcbK (DUF882 family)